MNMKNINQHVADILKDLTDIEVNILHKINLNLPSLNYLLNKTCIKIIIYSRFR